jgi:hypothetical protein
LGLDSGNGSEFINEWFRDWRETHTVRFARSRPCHKNDNLLRIFGPSQTRKNNLRVRNYAGYRRFDSLAERDALNAPYQFFSPFSSRVRKIFENIPKSPCRRLLESPELSGEVKAELKQCFSRYDPVLLQKQVRRAVDALPLVYNRIWEGIGKIDAPPPTDPPRGTRKNN